MVANAQTIKIDETDLEITFPENTWAKLNGLDKNVREGYTTIGFMRKTDPSSAQNGNATFLEKTFQTGNVMDLPSTIVVENKPVNKSAAGYAVEKNRLAGYTILKTYTGKNGTASIVNLPEVVVQKVMQEMPALLGGTMKGYVVFIVSQKKGIVISWITNKDIFDKYEQEYLQILHSIKSTAASVEDSKSEKPAIAAGKLINICEYFPLGKRMVYKYLESSKNNSSTGNIGNLF
jgi:hypothetical protein